MAKARALRPARRKWLELEMRMSPMATQMVLSMYQEKGMASMLVWESELGSESA
jgi:hypothetical protein